MYETYVPIRVERKPPTIAEIVRQKTDDGARIIDFFLDIMEGRVDDARLCHRIDAAKQLVKYGSKKAADFIAEHGDEPCDHCESRKRGPRPRKDVHEALTPSPSTGEGWGEGDAPHLTPDFLTMLTEDFLTVLSAVDEDLMIKLLRAQTRDGGTVIDFLDDVMEGRNARFKPNHRIAAARELISHILRDEHAFAHAVLDNVEPAPYSIRRADPRVRPLPGSETPSPSTLTPSPSTEEGGACPESPRRSEGDLLPLPQGEGWGEGDSPDTTTTIVIPAANPTVVPAKAGTQGARGATTNGASAEPVPSTDEGPNPTVVPANAGFLPQEPSPTQRGVEGRSGPQLRTNNQQPRTLPGRSPP